MPTSEAERIAAYVIHSIEERPACTPCATAATWPGPALTHGAHRFLGRAKADAKVPRDRQDHWPLAHTLQVLAQLLMRGRLHRHTVDELQARLHAKGHDGIAVVVGAVHTAAMLGPEPTVGSSVSESTSQLSSLDSSVTGSSLHQSPEHTSVPSQATGATASSLSSPLSGASDSLRIKHLRNLRAAAPYDPDSVLSEYGSLNANALGGGRPGMR